MTRRERALQRLDRVAEALEAVVLVIKKHQPPPKKIGFQLEAPVKEPTK